MAGKAQKAFIESSLLYWQLLYKQFNNFNYNCWCQEGIKALFWKPAECFKRDTKKRNEMKVESIIQKCKASK